MKQVLIFGASTVHGVGGENGGWADKLKIAFHKDMFGANPQGEALEVYELGVPGETTAEVLGRFESELKSRTRGNSPSNICIVLSAGLNDSKAVDAIDNHLSTPDDFAATLHSFIHLAREYSGHIIGIGSTPVNEAKANPKHNPVTGKSSYFSNERIALFEETFRRTCDEEGISFVPLCNQVPQNWQSELLWDDGVHPNDAGHAWIASQVEPRVRELAGLADD